MREAILELYVFYTKIDVAPTPPNKVREKYENDRLMGCT